jgi:hypothetical protein
MCVNSYNTNQHIHICTNLWSADIPKKQVSKKFFPLEPRYVGMCFFSTKTMRHWRMQFDTPARTISCLYQDTIQDLRLIWIHLHAIANPIYQGVFGWNIASIHVQETCKSTTHNPGPQPMSLTMISVPSPDGWIFIATALFQQTKMNGDVADNLL